MKTVNVRTAKTHLSRLLDRVHGGEEIVIAKSVSPMRVLYRFASESLSGDRGR
jgi:antitoxin (DNA-binding transcriptional repressor) of toxin-antitoxin stability system